MIVWSNDVQCGTYTSTTTFLITNINIFNKRSNQKRPQQDILKNA